MQRLHASRRIFASIAGAAGADLTQQGVDILTVLADGAARPIGDVARSARMDAGAVSRQLNRLEDDGYVRRDGATRGSVVLVTATKRGRALLDKVEAVRNDQLQRGCRGGPSTSRPNSVDCSCAWPTTCRARRYLPVSAGRRDWRDAYLPCAWRRPTRTASRPGTSRRRSAMASSIPSRSNTSPATTSVRTAPDSMSATPWRPSTAG